MAVEYREAGSDEVGFDRAVNPVITGMRTVDVRFPTSARLDGSDAMNPDPDYSAAYVVLETDGAGLEGHGLTFTLGRGNELCVAAIEALGPLVIGLDLASVRADPAGFWRIGEANEAMQSEWLSEQAEIAIPRKGA